MRAFEAEFQRCCSIQLIILASVAIPAYISFGANSIFARSTRLTRPPVRSGESQITRAEILADGVCDKGGVGRATSAGFVT